MADPKNFNYKRYEAPDNPIVVDGSDALANKGVVISFMHMPSGKEVFFKAFINTFNETYSSDWAGETVYGRADPIYMFKQTQRKIAIAFMVPATSAGEAYENLAKAQLLVQFLYPMYTDIQSATTIAQSPLVRLKFSNLLQTVGNSTTVNTKNPSETYAAYKSSNDASQGLLGAITSLTINHNLDNLDMGAIEKGAEGALEALLPRNIEVVVDFAPIHEHTVGWIGKDGSSTPEFAAPNFPYGAQLSTGEDTSQDAAPTYDDFRAEFGYVPVLGTVAADDDTLPTDDSNASESESKAATEGDPIGSEAAAANRAGALPPL
jgi:hypothetical protein